MSNSVNHPPHYGGADNPYEAIKVIEAWGLGFCVGNAVKYIARAGKKPETCSVLPLSTYSHMFAKVNLHNLFHFLDLRLHEHAQYEIRVYAEAMAEIVKVWVPHVWEAFEDYRLHAMSLSRGEIALVKQLLGDAAELRYADGGPHGLSKREMREFSERLGIPLSD